MVPRIAFVVVALLVWTMSSNADVRVVPVAGSIVTTTGSDQLRSAIGQSPNPAVEPWIYFIYMEEP